MARMNRTSGRQVLVTTHSAALLRNEGIDLAEVNLLEPGEEGTVVLCAADLDDVRLLVEHRKRVWGGEPLINIMS